MASRAAHARTYFDLARLLLIAESSEKRRDGVGRHAPALRRWHPSFVIEYVIYGAFAAKLPILADKSSRM